MVFRVQFIIPVIQCNQSLMVCCKPVPPFFFFLIEIGSNFVDNLLTQVKHFGSYSILPHFLIEIFALNSCRHFLQD